jgi:hypothetical protein
MIKKTIILVGAATSTTTSVAATLAAGIVAAGVSAQLGFDPWPWVFAAIGGGVMRVKMAPSTKIDGAANGVVSIVLGGGAGPWAHEMIFDGQKHTLPIYVIAFGIACIWPWLAKLGKAWIETRFKK